MNLEKLQPLTDEYLESIGFVWHTDEDDSSYVADEIVQITEDEANTFYEATNELYDMFCEAGEYVIENNLFHDINIPFQDLI
jgi:glutathionylspermidine synthase